MAGSEGYLAYLLINPELPPSLKKMHSPIFSSIMIRQTNSILEGSGRRTCTPASHSLLTTTIHKLMNIKLHRFIAVSLFLCLCTAMQVSIAQETDIQISVCTLDIEGSAPLDGAVVVMQLGNQQPVGGTTAADGCVDITIEVPTSTSTEDITPIPQVFSVQPPYPNPFMNEVSIPVAIEQTQSVSFEIFAITGRSVAQPLETVLATGQHRFTVKTDGLNAGLYLYQIIGEQGSASGKLVKVGATKGSSNATEIRVQAAEFAPEIETPVVRSVARTSNTFAVRIDAMRQGYLAARSDLEVSDGEEVVLNMEKVDPGVPSAPLLSLPGNGSVGVGFNGTELEWTGDDLASSYSVQVSKSADFSSVDVQQEGWPAETYTLPELDPATLYYWRVRSTGDQATSEWSLTYQFLTLDDGATPPSIPILSSPSNGATDVLSTDVELEWVTAEDAVNYRVQLATTSDFSVLIVDVDGVLGTTYSSAELFADTEYFWRVRANGQGGVSDWSDEYSFSTISADGLPGVPTLSSPSNGATDITPGVISLSWEAETSATSYDYQMSTVPSFSSLVDEQLGVTATSLESIELGQGVTYYWHVRAVNENGMSEWSSLYSFTTTSDGGGGGAPATPFLTAPSDGATGISPSGVNLTWNASPNATSYDVQLAATDDFSSIVDESLDQAGTSALFNDVAPNTTHYWRARASNAEGTSDWSNPFSFTTGEAGSENEMIALDLMGPNDTYYGLPGGLVDNGVPTVTETNNKIIIVAISMSNGYQEFNQFINLYKNHPDISNQVEFENCAVGGSALERWLTEDSLWQKCKDKISDLSAVKVVWAKNANQFTAHGLTLPDPGADYYDLVENIGAISQRIGEEFPSVQAVFHSSRIWGGYVTGEKQAARGEPMSYEGGFATNTVIEQYQQGQLPGAPWIGWGPYIWANGETPNGSGIFWTLNDFQDGGVNQHPSEAGATKVADALHEFLMQFDWYRN